MKILSAEDIRNWDEYTINHEPVLSIDLMERAAMKCTEWLLAAYPSVNGFVIFCGKGNNGGDGLAIARLLMDRQFNVEIFILEFGHLGTADFQTNLARLQKMPAHNIHFIQTTANFHTVSKGYVIIDSLFGSGLNRAPEGVTAALIHHINESGNPIVAIDIPSGLYTERSSADSVFIKATHTLTFQNIKKAFLYGENEEATGELHILDIGLHPEFYASLETPFELIDPAVIKTIHKPRKRFSHKGNFGHALLIAGSHGKMGAAVLAARGCLRTGVGLLTCHVPGCGNNIMQVTVPEAMVITDVNENVNSNIDYDLTKYDAIGIGPGSSTGNNNIMLLRNLLDAYRNPVVIDADGLNTIAMQRDLLQLIPAGSIFTPHPKEFDRVFGESSNAFERTNLALQSADKLNVIIIVKGHHSFIAIPGYKGFYNSTGNAGMATAGSGDVLTGILTALIAQGYSAIEASILGVYLHGYAGDLAAENLSEESMLAGDIVENLGPAFKSMNDTVKSL